MANENIFAGTGRNKTGEERVKKTKSAGLAKRVLNAVKRHRGLTVFIIIAAILFILVIQAIANVRSLSNRYTEPRTVQLYKRNIEQAVTASGVISSTDITNVTGLSQGFVQDIYVKVGDKVAEGAILARLNPESIDRQIASLKESLADARKKVNDQISAETKKLNNYQAIYSENKISLDRAVSDAKTVLDAAKAAEENRAGQAAYNQSLNEKITADSAKAVYDIDPGNAALKEAWETAHRIYEDKWQQVYANTYSSGNFIQAQTAYDSALMSRETRLRENQALIDASNAAIEQLRSSDSVKSLERQLKELDLQREDTIITATASGTVTQVNAVKGSISTGSMFVIMDLNSLQVEAEVAEYDMTILTEGMKVSITSDAIASQTWEGTLTHINPVASDTGNFPVSILISGDLSRLKGGMSAKISIITASKNDVFAVPYNCVVKDETGRDTVHVLAPRNTGSEDQDTPREQRIIPVTRGLELDYYVEISSPELTEGMDVIDDPLNINTTNNTLFFMRQ